MKLADCLSFLTPLFYHQLKIKFASNDIRAYMACWLSIGTGLGIFGWVTVVVVIVTILKLQYWKTLYSSITQGIFTQVTFYTI